MATLLQKGDTVIDGGNTFYRDDISRAKTLAPQGLHYVDCGTSGGVWGSERGYCMMIGGDKDGRGRGSIRSSPRWRPAPAPSRRRRGARSRDPRVEHGYIHAGPAGAGHFVKMIHNGIEYGLMQAYAEGFDILHGKMSDASARG